MSEVVENSFRGLVAALQTAKLYGTEHAKFFKFLDKAYEGFQEAFKGREELVFGIVADELAFEKEVLFDLSRAAKPSIVYIRSRGIEKMDFRRLMTKEELRKLLELLVLPKEEAVRDPQDMLTSMGVKNIIVGKIKDAKEKDGVMEAINYLTMFDNSLDNFNRSLENVLQSRELDHTDLRFNVSMIFENLATRHSDFLKLTSMKRYDLTTFSHILNVSILSMFFATKLGIPKEEVLEIGTAALFHDIGKTYISRKILRKTDKLSVEEFETIKGHTVLGAEMLLKYVDTLGVLPVVVAFEHHLKSDFKSYPKMAFPRKSHLASAIIGVCDIYDALSTRRSYKASLAPVVVYEILMKEKEKLPYPGLVDDFFKVMGVFPIGTLVVLSDSRVAVVREENEGEIFSPKVEVVSPPDKKEMIDLLTDRSGLKIDKSLDPLLEGKPYIPLI
jgi:putative nucleotidyltransferase with HDIG domain